MFIKYPYSISGSINTLYLNSIKFHIHAYTKYIAFMLDFLECLYTLGVDIR